METVKKLPARPFPKRTVKWAESHRLGTHGVPDERAYDRIATHGGGDMGPAGTFWLY